MRTTTLFGCLRFALFTVACAALAPGQTSKATIIFDNFDADGGFHPQNNSVAAEIDASSAGSTNGTRAAAQFTVTGGNFNLTSVTLPISVQKNDPGDFLRVRLASDVAGVPGPTVEVLSENQSLWPNLSDPFTTTTTILSLANPLLYSGQKYWIVTEPTTIPTGFEVSVAYQWFLNSSGSSVLFWQESESGIPADPWSGNSFSTNVAFRVEGEVNTNTTPPVFTCANDKTVDCGSSWSFDTPVVADACSGTNVTITILDTETNGVCPQIITRTWVAADLCGNTNTCSQSVTVQNTNPPVFTCANDKTVDCGSSWSFDTPVVADACSGTNVTITILDTGTNGVCPQIITRTWVAADLCGNTNTCSQSVTMQNTNPPVFICGNNETVECGSAWAFDIPAATDACSGTNVTIIVQSTVTNGLCPKVITRTWMATDLCGNTNTCSQTVTVVDTTPPVFINCPASTNLGCNPVNIPDCDSNVNAIDNCGSGTAPAYLLVSGAADVKRYNGTTGAFIDTFVTGGSGGLNGPQDLVFGPDGNLYLSSYNTSEVKRYNGTTGAFIDTFASGGGLNEPYGLVFGPDANLYVSSFFTDEVKRYDGTTGAFIDTFVAGGSGGLNGPQDLVFGPDGNLYVSSFYSVDVKRYDGTTGAFIDIFVPFNSGGLSGPYGLVFGPDSNLYASSYYSGEVKRYNGTTGAFIDTFIPSSSDGLNGPYGLVFAPDGNLYVSSSGTFEVKRYNGTTGAFIDTFVPANSGGLSNPTYLIFTPSAQPPQVTCAKVDTTNGCTLTRTITYTAVDACNNSNTCTQVITWTQDTTPPVFICVNDKTVDCGSSWSFDTPIVSDDCSGTNVTITILNTVTNGSECSQTIIRNWLATDGCGNSNTCDQTITVQRCVPPPSCLVSWWPGDGNANDIVGPNSGTLQGDATFASGETGLAFSFNGSNSWVQVPDSPSLEIAGPFTIEVWVQPNGIDNSTDRWPIVWKGNSVGQNVTSPYALGLLMNNQIFATVGDGIAENDVTSSVQLEPGVWHHLAFVADGTQLSLYVNGVLDSSAPQTLTPSGYSFPFVIGGGLGSPLNTFDGLIDEVSLYNCALSSNQISSIYAFGADGKCKASSSTLACSTNKTINCGMAWDFDPPTGVDACCGSNLAVTVLNTITNGSGCSAVITRTWQATDCCSNVAACTQTVTVVVAGPPITPVIVGINYDAVGAHIIIQTQPCYTYALECQNSLTDPTWNICQTATGNGTNWEFIDPPPLPTARFYRVRLLCP